ncbi:phosphinothricin N-acetyltransferase [Rhizoclosmatium globosum]|uniref:Phosphinothricin N-acetyltransferase n=1 Tax=Rhizoclosmatium globosum TaxID=329046 RepID=A0A1Y2C4Y0_9FUNG|nr:phosphinothricin N-acetyltransferase [Rhizoclosmatium globosum]|eukprot:ORY41375.1 phosphinothricin N-acetyltransferase [Rhizoclosmatium globosum]
MIRPATENDAEAIRDIYQPYITDTIITFEEEPVSVEEIRSRITKILADGYPYFVYEDPETKKILGYCYSSQFRTRNAYRFCTESSLYLINDDSVKGKGLGTLLYKHLIEELRVRKFHTVLGVVSLPNEASAKLHEKLGFTKCCHLRESGFKFGKWIDVGFWELIL